MEENDIMLKLETGIVIVVGDVNELVISHSIKYEVIAYPPFVTGRVIRTWIAFIPEFFVSTETGTEGACNAVDADTTLLHFVSSRLALIGSLARNEMEFFAATVKKYLILGDKLPIIL